MLETLSLCVGSLFTNCKKCRYINLGPNICKWDMKWRLTTWIWLISDLISWDLSLCRPYIRAFWRGKQKCRNHV